MNILIKCCICRLRYWIIDVLFFCMEFFQEAELEQLEKTVEPSWPKLVEPLEKIIDRLSVVWGMINHLKAVKDTPELRAAIEEVQVDCYCNAMFVSAHEWFKSNQSTLV